MASAAKSSKSLTGMSIRSSNRGCSFRSHFTGDFEADFVTLAPYMGLDSISPYLPYAEKQGKGLFVLCRTSNGGAKDFEYEKLADGRHVYDLVGDKLNALGKDYMGCRYRHRHHRGRYPRPCQCDQ